MLVLIVCKTISGGPADQNEAFTHWRRLRLGDRALDDGVPAQRVPSLVHPIWKIRLGPMPTIPLPPLNPDFTTGTMRARRSPPRHGLGRGTSEHALACLAGRLPGPDRGYGGGAVIGYKLPECGPRDTVISDELGHLARRT